MNKNVIAHTYTNVTAYLAYAVFSYYSLIFFSFFYKLININANALQYELNNEANWQKTKCFLGQSEPRFTVH